jgi:hypothetical protein
MNDELLIGIKDIYTFVDYIYKGIESDYSVDIIDFRLNNREATLIGQATVIYYTHL